MIQRERSLCLSREDGRNSDVLNTVVGNGDLDVVVDHNAREQRSLYMFVDSPGSDVS